MEGTIAEIRLFAGNFAPRNWQLCQGQLISISTNTALFSLLGQTYGGDGRVTFGLPDLRGRVAVGTGQGTNLPFINLGEVSGEPTHTLVQSEMPTHTHQATVSGNPTLKATAANATDSVASTGDSLAAPGTGTGRTFTPGFGYDPSSPSVELNQGSISISGISVINGMSGASQPHGNMQPYLGLNYIICMYGIFPSRN